MRTTILENSGFSYTAEVRRIEAVGDCYSVEIASRWTAARDPGALRRLVQITLDTAGLLALRNLIDAKVAS